MSKLYSAALQLGDMCSHVSIRGHLKLEAPVRVHCGRHHGQRPEGAQLHSHSTADGNAVSACRWQCDVCKVPCTQLLVCWASIPSGDIECCPADTAKYIMGPHS